MASSRRPPRSRVRCATKQIPMNLQDLPRPFPEPLPKAEHEDAYNSGYASYQTGISSHRLRCTTQVYVSRGQQHLSRILTLYLQIGRLVLIKTNQLRTALSHSSIPQSTTTHPLTYLHIPLAPFSPQATTNKPTNA
jgi:hypothetical protein